VLRVRLKLRVRVRVKVSNNRRVGTEVTIRLVLPVVISRLDYCNSLL